MTPEILSHVKGMERAGKLAAQTLQYVGSYAKSGTTTEELDKIATDFILRHEARPAPLNYKGYPKSICTSVNDVVCHGVPDQTRLKDGDILNIDVTVVLDGFFGDTSAMFAVGNISPEAKKICEVAKGARDLGIEQVKPGNTEGDVGFVTYKYVTRNGFYIVRQIGGHGIGRIFHDDAYWIPAFGSKGKGRPFKAWDCITVEPMINQTSEKIKEYPIPNSGHAWYTTHDKSLSAQWEHTILITDKGHEILTLC